MPRILIVEDDPEISRLVAQFLRDKDYHVAAVADGKAMSAVMATQAIDIVLLDLMLPEVSGLDLCKQIRATGNARIIMVTALASLSDRVAGLDAGADDYVSKPFALPELEARIRAVSRRGQDGKENSTDVAGVRFGGWRFEAERRVLYSPRGVRITLTAAEADLLLAFQKHAHQVLSRPQLIELTRGKSEGVSDRAIDLLVSRLRRKLALGGRQLEIIQTVRSDGYVFNPQD
ncbi:two-component system response regulator [Methylocella silvestris]|uniref:Two-component system response regulator n=2 Tax=Methylocella silvestris TaxID=199596 RepID=A0A2J7TCT6_METSI|nr:two-component system response regulator [Methylocella silvestris]